MRTLICLICLLLTQLPAFAQQTNSQFQPVDIQALLKQLGLTLQELQAMAVPETTAQTAASPSQNRPTGHLTSQPAAGSSQQQTTSRPATSGPGPIDRSLPGVIDLGRSSTLPLPDNKTPTGPPSAVPTTMDQKIAQIERLGYAYVATPYFEPLNPTEFRPQTLVRNFDSSDSNRVVIVPHVAAQQPVTQPVVLRPAPVPVAVPVAVRVQPVHRPVVTQVQVQSVRRPVAAQVQVQPVNIPVLPAILPTIAPVAAPKAQPRAAQIVIKSETVQAAPRQIPRSVETKPVTPSRAAPLPVQPKNLVTIQPGRPAPAHLFTFEQQPVPWSVPVTHQPVPVPVAVVKVGGNVPIYDLTASYKIFAKHFVVSTGDPYLSTIQKFLVKQYTIYLQNSEITAAFRRYYQGRIQYLILAKVSYGTFLVNVDYIESSGEIKVKSLAIISFSIQEADYTGCHVRDQPNENCRTCQTGFTNFRGRCHKIDPLCHRAITDECLQCKIGSKLVYGICQ